VIDTISVGDVTGARSAAVVVVIVELVVTVTTGAFVDVVESLVSTMLGHDEKRNADSNG